ncbi:sodium-dependent bicarbonate transport family permease [Deinococcus yavapaiensis]|uniref:Sodium-dependent bicarbonate transport family permease n=1 Tax=Deinococcus yavapaiensis KR-236 TaxID=694435 RepID=A0A318SD75_9DEIO|nr:sodium-dependent bicarbonate transport family permease [Deinococcus yavapaiensis]PYE54841.1 hypothetical protein DES52_104112 [Deinococcus yavapaiensis KR-236]
MLPYRLVDALDLLRLNLLSPMVLAFVLGMVAVFVRSDLRLPEALYTSLSIYLLLSIGLKGGAELSETPFATLVLPALATLVLGVTIPVVVYAVMRRVGRFGVADAAAVAAHYGSVSAVTFTAAITTMSALDVRVEGFMPALVALLEVPAIVVALSIARSRLEVSAPGAASGRAEVWRELLTGRSLFVLLGGLVIGALGGKAGLAQVAPFFVDPFKGALVLFLLEMGMVAAGRIRDLKKVGPFVIGFGLLAPIVNGSVGVLLATLSGLSIGGSTILGVMAASASYIAAPAAVRIALPQANPALYLGASLGVTFPFNLSVGIPLMYALSRALHGLM